MGWCSGTAGSRTSKSGPRSHPSLDLLSSMCSLHWDTLLCVASSQTFEGPAQPLRKKPPLGPHAISTPGRAVSALLWPCTHHRGLPRACQFPPKEPDKGEQEEGQRSQHNSSPPCCSQARCFGKFSQKLIFPPLEDKMNLFSQRSRPGNTSPSTFSCLDPGDPVPPPDISPQQWPRWGHDQGRVLTASESVK